MPLGREVMYEDGPDGLPVVTGLRMSRAGQERVVKADAYVAALDVPGAKKLIPQVLPAAVPTAGLGNSATSVGSSGIPRSLPSREWCCRAVAGALQTARRP